MPSGDPLFPVDKRFGFEPAQCLCQLGADRAKPLDAFGLGRALAVDCRKSAPNRGNLLRPGCAVGRVRGIEYDRSGIAAQQAVIAKDPEIAGPDPGALVRNEVVGIAVFIGVIVIGAVADREVDLGGREPGDLEIDGLAMAADGPETDWQLSVRENGKAASQVGEGF